LEVHAIILAGLEISAVEDDGSHRWDQKVIVHEVDEEVNRSFFQVGW
jgi:hypothetical protein